MLLKILLNGHMKRKNFCEMKRIMLTSVFKPWIWNVYMLQTASWLFMAYNFRLIAFKLRPSRSKKRKNFSWNKKTCADLNFLSIDPKFSYIVDSFMAYKLRKFQIDSTKIEAWVTHEAENFWEIKKRCCTDLNFWAIDL